MHKTVHNQCELFKTISYFKKVILIICCIVILHYIINDLLFQQGKVVKNWSAANTSRHVRFFFYKCGYKNIYYLRSLIFPKITVGPKWADYWYECIKKMNAITYCPIRLYIESWEFFVFGVGGEGLGVGYQMLGQSKFY